MRWLMATLTILWCLSAQAAVTLWTESANVMILPDRPAPEVATEIAVTGVRNEVLAVQLALRGESAEPLSFRWGDLINSRGTIPQKNLTLYRAALIDVQHGQKVDATKDPKRARPHGRFPDALVPLYAADGSNVANTIKPQAGQTIAFWVDIRIADNIQAGDYTGRIELLGGQTVVASVPVSVNVRNAAIPARASMPSIYNLRTHPHIKANLDAYVVAAIDHRLQPNNTHFMDFLDKPDGLSTVDQFNPGAQGWASVYLWYNKVPDGPAMKKLLSDLRRLTDHLKERGLFERSFIYLHDEPDLADIPAMVEVVDAVTRELPEWKGKFLDTLNKERTALDPLVTHHVRALKMYGPWTRQPALDGRAEWDKRRAEGQQLWFYVSNAQGVPFPTFDINTPNLAYEPRVLGWAWWYEKAHGHLYWDLLFQPAWKLTPKFPPGDGQLMYPGDFTLEGAPDWVQTRDLKAPVPSRRLKVFRQGLQDWELLKLAEQKHGREKVQQLVDRVYTTMGQRTWAPDAYNPAKPMWSYDESAWESARTELLKLVAE